ncbi:uncharacterized protein TM35_000132200 [Trypanosoma theileri]|uniref:Inositol 1,4,5-trisphosphate receptor n=1 Tax=Trypanosoma theileri TaxID=67003 RepID=A0A1X0NWX8_9TRYP|nr:uncharacterized protein TM35_000132200 [Trypanosoma theileri]ORC89216.1 hypothetical protein TM35_000132200 [Trypanosoma theileri]
MDRKRLTIKYGSLVHISCDDGFITASGIVGETLFLRSKTEIGIDGDSLPLLGFEKSVFQLAAPTSSLAAKVQKSPEGGGGGNKTLLLDHFSKINTAPEIVFGQTFLLVHSISGMLVATIPSEPSENDPDCVRLTLVRPEEVSPARCEFVFVSRYKIHNEGDPVCRGDEVLIRQGTHRLFLNVTIPMENKKEMPLHVTPMNLTHSDVGISTLSLSESSNMGERTVTTAPEVNASEEKCVVLVVDRHDIGRDQANYQRAIHHIPRPYIPAGVPIAFYHRERESLLATSLAMPPQQQQQGLGKTMSDVVGDNEECDDDDIPGGILTTRQYHSVAEGVVTSRGATVAGKDISVSQGIGNSNNNNNNNDNNNDADYENCNANNDTEGIPYPLLVEDTLSLNTPMREEGDLDNVSCSCAALWILENEEPMIGGAVRLQSIQYRIRQACSNLYLAVTGSGVDAFFDDIEGNNVRSSSVDGDETKSQQDSDYSDDTRDKKVRPTTLCMIPPPRSQKDLNRTLFTVSPMFASECNFLIENECLVLQNVLTGMYVCTEETSRRVLLQWKPPAHDTIVARRVHADISENVIFLWTQCERLCSYRDAFQALISIKQQEGKGKGKEKGQQKQEKQLFKSEEEEEEEKEEEEEEEEEEEGKGEKLSYGSLFPIIRTCQRTLKELIRFCSLLPDRDVLRQGAVPISKHQRMMFDLHIQRLLFDIILTPYSLLSSTTTENLTEGQMERKSIWGNGQWGCKPQLPQQPLSGGVIHIENALDKVHTEVYLVCCLAFQLLKQMVYEAPKLKSGYDDFIPYLLELDKHGFHVVEVITEIFQNNANLPITMVERVSDHFVEVLGRVRSAGILHLLSSMCVIGFRGISERQAIICQKLLLEKNEVLCRFVLDYNGEWAVATSRDKTPVSYQDFFNPEKEKGRHTQNISESLVEFVENEVELLGRLCFDGCPPICCEEVAKIFPEQVLLEAVRKFVWTGAEVVGRPSSMDVLRGHILRLAIQCYIMPKINDPAVELRVATVLFGSSSLRRDVSGNTPLSCKPDDDLIKVVKIATLGIIRANPHFVYSDVNRSILLRTSLNIWLRFVKSHQISTNETRTLIPPLLSLLDSSKDVINLMGINMDNSVIGSGGNSSISIKRSDNNNNSSDSLSLKLKCALLQMSEANIQVMRARDMICRTLLHLLDCATHGTADEIIMYLHDIFAKGNEPTVHPLSQNTVSIKSPDVECSSDIGPNAEEVSLLPKRPGFLNIFKRHRKGYQSIDDEVELTDVEGRRSSGGSNNSSRSITPSEVVDYLRCACKDILDQFRVEELVPRLMDLVCYDNPQLKAQSTELLIRLCMVKRNVAHRVLQVHTLPSIEVTRNFDNLYTVAVDVLILQRRGRVSDAVALALDSVDEKSLSAPEEKEEEEAADSSTVTIPPAADSSKGEVKEIEMVEHPSEIDDTSNDDNNNNDDDDESTPLEEGELTTVVTAPTTTTTTTSTTHTFSGSLRGRSLWAKTAGAARMLSYRHAVRVRRRSMGLGETSNIPLRLVIRMEMVCHWRIHITMLQMHSSIDPSDLTFFHWMRFFYLFTLSRSNAKALQGNIDLFMDSLSLNEECTAMCLHIIVAILATIADPTPHITTKFLKECVKFLDHEVALPHPDSEFPSKLSAGIFEKSTVSVVVRRRMLQLLREHHIMRCLPQPDAKVAPVASAFIASMLELLCQICGSEMSAVSMGQQLLPLKNILCIIMEYGTRFNPLRRRSHGQQTTVEKNAFLLVGTYLRALLLLYITSDEDESEGGKLHRQMEWMGNNDWWAVVQLLGDQMRGLTVLINAGVGKVVNRGLHIVQRYRKVWLMTVPVALLSFFAECFTVVGYYKYIDKVETIFCELCESALQFCTKLLEHSNALELQVREVVNYRRCLALLMMHASHINGLQSLANRLEAIRNHMRLWLLDSRQKANEMEQIKGKHRREESAPVDANDDGISGHEVFFPGESASQSLQNSSVSTSAGLFLSSAAIKCRDIELIRGALRPFIRRDVLIPVEDSINPSETASVINALLQRSPVLSSVQDFISNILDGLRKRLFTPIAFVGLLNCLHNALYLALQEGKNNQQKQQDQGQEKEKEGKIGGEEEEDTGYVLQLTFSDLGVTYIVASLCALEDVVVTYSAMRLGVVLLDGGNKRAQNALMRYFETHQEGFFQNVRDVLQKGLQWVWRVNTEHELVILERGGIVVNVSNMRLFALMLLTNAGASTSRNSSSGISSSKRRRRLSGWDRMYGSLHLRLICTLFRMLQLFCEGHNFSMQNYIRCQHDNMHSVNIVHDVMVFLAELSRIIHPATFDTVRGGFELLTELCQGPCHANQLALLNYDVCSTIYHVVDMLYKFEMGDSMTTNTLSKDKSKIKKNENDSSDDENNDDNNNNTNDGYPIAVQQNRTTLTMKDIGCLRISLTTCLLSLIEGSHETALVRRVLVQIPIDIIEREIGSIQPNVFDRILNDEELEDDPGVEAFFKWLIFLQIVRPFADGVYLQHIDEILRRTKKLHSRIGVIEIRRADGVLEKVFFRIPLICCGLTGSIKNNVLWEINRTSRATKLGDFLHRSDNIIFKVERAHAFHRWVVHWTQFKLETDTGNGKTWSQLLIGTLKGWWNAYIAPILFSSQLSFYEYASLMVAVLANMSLIFIEGAQWSSEVLQMWRIAISCFCVLQLILSCMALAVDTVVFFPVCLYTEYRYKQHMSSGRAKLNVTMQEVFDGLSKMEIVSLFCTRFEIQFRVFLVFMAILSLSVSHFFAAAHLLLVIYKTPTLRTFIAAITQNGKQLLLTALLGVVVLYLFAIVGYLLFPSEFGGDDDDNNNNNNNNKNKQDNENCNNLFRCFMFILWQGLRQGGGVGDVMQEEPWSSSTLIPRVSYDLIFFALVNVVFLNIMFGLIIDTFGELRDDKREKHMDMVSICFICGLEADVFERVRIGGFHTHIMEEHNMWMYLYFMHYLRRKDPNDFTGQESYVHEKIQENDLGFFPEEECLSLEEETPEKEKDEDEHQDSIEESKLTTTGGAKAKATTTTTTGGGAAAAAAGGGGGGGPGGVSGMADSQAVALTLKELASVKEALSVFVRDISTDAQKVKSMIHQLEITSRSVHGTSVAGSAAHKASSASGTHVSRGSISRKQLHSSDSNVK